ncbi:sensor histidine kinase [Embleya scabrispora]|uniref:sensor histidine kinase n=1 Tax=Embleya scabrispora TaxID=159449 RepID=UPI001F1D134A|nr:histidine kinase [Embleya scabrispora]
MPADSSSPPISTPVPTKPRSPLRRPRPTLSAVVRAVRAALVGLIVVGLWFALHPWLYAAEQSYTMVTTTAAAIAAVLLALPLGPLRKRPLPVLAIMTAEAIAALLLRDRVWPLIPALAILVGRYAADASRRNGTVAAGLVWAAWGAAFVGRWAVDTDSDALGDVLIQLAAGFVVLLIGWMMGTSARQRHDHLQALHAEAAARAVLAERLRIARELHDMVAHSIGVIAIQAGAASLVLDSQPAGARTALDAIESTSRQTLAELRRMLVSLRRVDGDTGPGGARLAPAVGLEGVERLVATAAEAGVRVDVTWHGQRRPLPPEIDLTAFRIIQESVTNTVRHSGTRRCRVCVEYLAEELAIEVVDDGGGGETGTTSAGTGSTGTGSAGDGGLGIAGMRERVALVGGRFGAGARPEGGFRVAARLPA